MLLDEIIATLSDSNSSLTDALLKTKVLLYQLGKKDLVPWVNNEIKGYGDEAEVPQYRIVRAEVRGHVISIGWRRPSYKLPIGHLTQEQQEIFTRREIRNSIQGIEAACRNYRVKGTAGGLKINIATELCVLFDKAFEAGAHCDSAWSEINMVEFENILHEVRSRVLDFALELKDAIGSDVSEQDLPKKANEAHADRLFNQAIYNTGSGIVIVGSHDIQIGVRRDDVEGLIDQIKKLGYEQKDLDALRQAVLEDKAAGRKPDITEGKTGAWVTEAFKKAGKGLVTTGVKVAVKVITEAIRHYAGA
jgi:AbiTii